MEIEAWIGQFPTRPAWHRQAQRKPCADGSEDLERVAREYGSQLALAEPFGDEVRLCDVTGEWVEVSRRWFYLARDEDGIPLRPPSTLKRTPSGLARAWYRVDEDEYELRDRGHRLLSLRRIGRLWCWFWRSLAEPVGAAVDLSQAKAQARRWLRGRQGESNREARETRVIVEWRPQEWWQWVR